MDIESRLQKIEAQVHQTRILVWVVLALVLAIGLGFLLVADHLGLLRIGKLVGYVELTLAVFVLIAMAYLLVLALVSAASGLWQFRTSREVDAQIFREAIAERAKTRGQAPNP
jgi:hypothetical protein